MVGIDEGAEFTVGVGMYRKWTQPGFMSTPPYSLRGPTRDP